MGLRLNPGEVKAMATSAKTALTNYNNELKEALPAIGGIVGEQSLQGRAYMAFKFHMADHKLVVLSLIAAGDEFANGLMEMSDTVGSEVLDEDDLKDGIKTCDESIATYEGHIRTYRQLLSNPAYYETHSSYAYGQINHCEGIIESYEETKAKLKAKLEKLFEIDAQLTSIVGRMESLYDGIDEGIQSLKSDWNGVGFTMPKIGRWRGDLFDRYQRKISEILTEMKNSVKGRDDTSMCYSKDPVNLATGNLIYDKDDLVISGRTPFAFKRFYNSISKHKGVLGCDFNHNFELRLDIKEDDDGQIGATIHFEDGKEDTFLQVDDETFDSYYGTIGSFEKLKDKETGTCYGYLYTRLDGIKYFFDTEGLYTRQEDGGGKGFSLEYEDEIDSSRLVRVVKDSGEHFELSYNEDGYLAEVKDHTERSATYHYDDGKLVKAIRPDGKTIEYEYSFNGKLRRVTNPRGVCVLTNMYDRSDRTVRQAFPDGSVMSYSYDDEKQTVTMTERNGAMIVYHHDEKYRNTKVEHPDGTEEFTYNDKNQRTKVKDKNGNETHFTYDNRGNVTSVVNALGTKLTLTYNGQNKPVTVKLDGKSLLKNVYDKKGNLIETSDAKGQKTRLTYDSKGNATQIIQADGSIIEITYDKRGNIKSLTNPDGSVISYMYDELNRVVKTTDALGNSTTYSYDINDNITEVTNPLGQSQTFAYNESNKVTEVTAFNGARMLYEYGVLNRPVSITDPLGNKTLFEYDSMWNLVQVTRPNGGEIAYRYDESNNLSEVEDAKGGIVKYGYDGNGNCTCIEDAEGNKTLLSYDALNRLVKVISPEGGETRYEYDTESNLIKVTDALGNEVRAEYDELGRVVKETNQLGAEREYTYDELGNLKEVISKEDGVDTVTSFSYKQGTDKVTTISYPDGAEEHFSYDANDNIITHTDKNGYTVAYSYDALNQLVKAEGQEGDKKEYEYDAAGNVTKVTDAYGNSTLYSYDLNNNLIKVTDALGNETAYDYDENDELVTIRQYEGTECDGFDLGEIKKDTESVSARIMRFAEEQANFHITRYTRNVLGQIEAITDAYGNQERFQYNKRGELISKLDKDGYLTKYSYTPAGDIAKIDYDDGRSVKLSYNTLRQLEEVKDWLGVTKITNNALGQVLRVMYPDGETVGYEYDRNGNRTTLAYPDGKKVSYLYDELGRLSVLKNDEHQVTYRYDKRSNLVEKVFENGVKTTYAYNSRGLLESLIHSGNDGVINEFSYEYDLLGNKTRVKRNQKLLDNSNGVYQYDYDSIGRLQAVGKDGSPLRTYLYDAYGNRTIREDYSGSPGYPDRTQYEYNALNQLITKADSVGVERYSYDRRGNLSAISFDGVFKNAYVYGATGRLEQATNAEGEIAKYLYNGLGNRIGKRIGTLPTEAIFPHEPGHPAPIDFHPQRCIDYTVDLTKEYNNLLVKSGDGVSCNYAFDSGLLLKEDELFLADELTSPVGRIGRNGDILAHAAYDEFGVELAGPVDEDFTFIGYQRDDVARTYYAQAREYLSNSGRFGAKDVVRGEIAYPYTQNNYHYCYSNPLSFVDMDGKMPTVLIGAGVGAVSGFVGGMLSELTDNKPGVNVKNVLVDTATGAGIGALAGTGIGIGALTAIGATSGAVNYGVKTTVNNEWKNRSLRDHLLGTGISAMEWGLAAFIGGKVASKPQLYGIKQLTGRADIEGMDATMSIVFRAVYKDEIKTVLARVYKELVIISAKNGLKATVVSWGLDSIFDRIVCIE